MRKKKITSLFHSSWSLVSPDSDSMKIEGSLHRSFLVCYLSDRQWERDWVELPQEGGILGTLQVKEDASHRSVPDGKTDPPRCIVGREKFRRGVALQNCGMVSPDLSFFSTPPPTLILSNLSI
jgi:hypothetical protein